MSRALEKAKESLASVRKGTADLRKKTKKTEDAGLGLLVGFGSSKYYGKWVAKRAKSGKSLTIKKLGMSYGRVAGGGLAVGGMLGMLGDDRTNTVGLLTGAALIGGDAALEGYLEEVAIKPTAAEAAALAASVAAAAAGAGAAAGARAARTERLER